jgi:hypothetical protein
MLKAPRPVQELARPLQPPPWSNSAICSNGVRDCGTESLLFCLQVLAKLQQFRLMRHS